MKKHHVVVLAYDQLCIFEFGCAIEIFGLSRPEIKVDWYDFTVCAVERGPIRAAGELTFKAPYALHLLDTADTIIIPGWRDLDTAPASSLLKKLNAAHERGTRICSICSGVFLLAATGLLDGKSATTHWKFATQLARRYPRIAVQPNALYVDEGQIVTSAGSAAGLDMMLHLVRSDFGSKVANQVAQRLVIAPHRSGGQAQFVPQPVQRDETGRLTKLMDWIRMHPAEQHTLSSMASRAVMTPRTLQRKFQETTRLTPIEWLVNERITIAKDMLEASQADISEVALAAGFASEESFRRHFRRLVDLSPSTYRRQFSNREIVF